MDPAGGVPQDAVECLNDLGEGIFKAFQGCERDEEKLASRYWVAPDKASDRKLHFRAGTAHCKPSPPIFMGRRHNLAGCDVG